MESKMKVLIWIYAIVGSLYMAMYCAGVQPVVVHATGLLWLLMTIAPPALVYLVYRAVAGRATT
jgi:hypothetical protein